jgi:glutaredoxin-like protein NrdH
MLTIYSKNACGYCTMAKGMLTNNDIPFEEVNIEENNEAYDFIISEGHRTMPQIYKDGKLFVEGGFQGLQSLGVDGIKQKLTEETVDTSNLGTL